MKTGILNKEEKAQIIELLKKKMSIEDIAKTLDRAEKSVTKYIDEVKELFGVDVKEAQEVEESIIPPSVLKRAMSQLTQMGLTKQSINAKINKIISNSTPEALKKITVELLVSTCIQGINVNDIMVTKTGNGMTGQVAIMTEGASEKADAAKQNRKPAPTPPHVFKIF